MRITNRVKILLIVLVIFLLIQWMFIGWRYTFGPFKSLGEVRMEKLPGNQEQYHFDTIEEMDDSPLKDKTVLFLGSSVTYGYSSGGKSIPEYIAKRYGCTSIKEAVSGTTLVDDKNNSYISRYRKNVSQYTHIDLLICQLSTNDASKEKPVGELSDSKDMDSFDTGTITGAIEYIIAYTKKYYDCPVIFYTNAYYDSDAYKVMVQRLYEIRQKWDIGIIDLYTDETFNNISEEERALYMYDDIHPTRAGYREWWGVEIEKQLNAFLKQ